jgi:DNA repair exonuclease SbcCD ATPase subunit
VDQGDIDQRIHELKVVRDRVAKYQRQQEGLQAKEIEAIKRAIREGKTEQAKFLIKQKRLRQTYIDRSEQRIASLQQMIDSIDTAQMNLQFVEQVKQSNDLLTKLNDLMPPDEVERIMDEQADLHSRVDEVSALISQDMNPEETAAAEQDYDAMVVQLFGDNAAPAAAQPEDEPIRMAALA